MATGFHPPLEEYLEAIHELEEEGVVVIQARLAERVGHSAPAVHETVRKLETDGYITIKDRELSLTEQGRSRAESVVRKHRLAERLLTDIIGLPWHLSHEEACRWEHVISDAVEERLVILLNNPTTCPHGNPIPGTGALPDGQIALADVDSGARFRLERVTEAIEIDAASLAYLGENGFMPGAIGVVQTKTPDATLVVQLASGSTLALGQALTAHLFVTLVQE